MADQISFARGAPSLDIVDVEGLKAAAAEAFDDRSGRHDRLRHLDRLPAAAQVDRRAPWRRARERDRHQRLDAGRRVPVRRARRAGRLGDRRAPDLRPHAAVAAQPRRRRAHGRARDRRDRRRRARARAGGGRQAQARPHHPQLPEPRRLHAVGAQARAAARARAQLRVHRVRGRPLRRAALRGRAAADDALDGRRERRLRVVVLEDRLPGDPRRLPRRARPS